MKKRFTRLLFRAHGVEPETGRLGKVLHRQALGKQVELLIQDATPDAAARLREHPDTSDVEESVPGLEDIYAAVMRNAPAPEGVVI